MSSQHTRASPPADAPTEHASPAVQSRQGTPIESCAHPPVQPNVTELQKRRFYGSVQHRGMRPCRRGGGQTETLCAGSSAASGNRRLLGHQTSSLPSSAPSSSVINDTFIIDPTTDRESPTGATDDYLALLLTLQPHTYPLRSSRAPLERLLWWQLDHGSLHHPARGSGRVRAWQSVSGLHVAAFVTECEPREARWRVSDEGL